MHGGFWVVLIGMISNPALYYTPYFDFYTIDEESLQVQRKASITLVVIKLIFDFDTV